MPKKIDPAVKERVVRRVLEHRQEYSSLTAASAAVARQERLGTETVRRWVLQAQVDASAQVGAVGREGRPRAVRGSRCAAPRR
jgi:transposase